MVQPNLMSISDSKVFKFKRKKEFKIIGNFILHPTLLEKEGTIFCLTVYSEGRTGTCTPKGGAVSAWEQRFIRESNGLSLNFSLLCLIYRPFSLIPFESHQ